MKKEKAQHNDKHLVKALIDEAKSNDKKVLVYPYEKRVDSGGKVAFRKEWHVMKEGNRTSKVFISKGDAVQFATKMSKGIPERLYVSVR